MIDFTHIFLFNICSDGASFLSSSVLGDLLQYRTAAKHKESKWKVHFKAAFEIPTFPIQKV
ncbi:hypothetical protein HY29_16145 [Hyphomonas beringensis]|uniref:Uncharacterized protein n=1 Tax=Hyphomonas beringensis TaxID=1280946 RepID=A0A062UAX6_9PROT|nr:hypothetical protein HY29_16145 [Hyphomonas beringensis]